MDEAIKPNDTIGGKVYDYFALIINYLVSAGDYPIVSTDAEKNFTLEVQSRPFDLIVTENSYFGILSSAKFLNVSTGRSHIIMNRFNISDNYFNNYGIIRVFFPEFAEYNTVVMKFASKDFFKEDEGFFTADSFCRSGSEYYIDKLLFLPKDKNSIEGKLYFIDAVYDYKYGGFTTIEKFGTKEITITTDENKPVRFTKEDIGFNPTERIVPVNINLPQGYRHYEPKISLGTPGYSSSSDLALYSRFGLNSEIAIPVMPSGAPMIKVTAEISEPSYYYYNGTIAAYFETGKPIDLNLSDSLTIVSPRNGEENITDTTAFEIHDASQETGIYEFIIFSHEIPISVFTEKKQIRFSDFKVWSHTLGSNLPYIWMARKFTGYHSVTEFLSTPYVFDSKLSHIVLSRDALIKTALK